MLEHFPVDGDLAKLCLVDPGLHVGLTALAVSEAACSLSAHWPTLRVRHDRVGPSIGTWAWSSRTGFRLRRPDGAPPSYTFQVGFRTAPLHGAVRVAAVTLTGA